MRESEVYNVCITVLHTAKCCYLTNVDLSSVDVITAYREAKMVLDVQLPGKMKNVNNVYMIRLLLEVRDHCRFYRHRWLERGNLFRAQHCFLIAPMDIFLGGYLKVQHFYGPHWNFRGIKAERSDFSARTTNRTL